MPHSPCMQALHFRHRTRLRLAPDTMGETVGLTGVGRGVGFMVCGLVMGMVGRRTLSRAWSFSWQQKQRGKWHEMSEPLHSAWIRKPLIPCSLAATSDNVPESSPAPHLSADKGACISAALGSSPRAHSLSLRHATPRARSPPTPHQQSETGLKRAAESQKHHGAPRAATLSF